MAIYILGKEKDTSAKIEKILSSNYKEIFLITWEDIMTGTLTVADPQSLLIIHGDFTKAMVSEIARYCNAKMLAMLLILDSDSYPHLKTLPHSPILMDVLQKTSLNAELLIRIDLLMRFQGEVIKRRNKEIELERTIMELNEGLSLAKRIQQLVLPKDLSNQDLKIEAIYEPSALLSGDLYYWKEIAPQEYGMILIDVSGHGVHAALVSMAMRSLFPGLIKRVKEPDLIAKELNHHMLKLFTELTGEHYVTSYFTAFIIYINTKQKEVKYVNAGHQPGILLMDEETTLLESSMVPIGLIQNPDIAMDTIHYKDDSKLLIFTDGLIETPYTIKENRFDEVLSQYKQLTASKSENILEKLLDYRKQAGHVNDDICAISVTFNKQ